MSPARAQTEGAPENILTEGDFSGVSGEFYAGWKPGGFLGGKPDTSENWANKVIMETDDKGQPYARLECLDPEGAHIGISQSEPITLNPAWTSLKISGLVKVSDYKVASDWGGRVQIGVNFFDSNSQLMPGEYYAGFSQNVPDWEPLEKDVMIPPGASSVQVFFNIMGANGVADARDLKLSAE